jgi:hypothetical protein
MLKSVLVTSSIAIIVGFAGSLLTLFGGGSLSTEYMKFAVALILFVVILIGSYWFVMWPPNKNR